jgi:hypothetical protein
MYVYVYNASVSPGDHALLLIALATTAVESLEAYFLFTTY